jgi:nucleotide-binding universal stress UspA family protein
MFRHILVPLDGSALAESALPAAAYLADRLHSGVTLAHVIEAGAPETVHGQRHLARPEEAEAYLADVAQRAFPAGIQVNRHVHTAATRDMAQSIIDHAVERTDTLIVMCTHGRKGLGSLLMGTIAQHVAGGGRTPVLLIPPEASPEFACQRILVPLDGQPIHEQAVALAAGIAGACKSAVHLLFVVPTRATLPGPAAPSGLLLPGTTRAVLEMAQKEAAPYLERQAAPLKAAGLPVTQETQRGDAATAILASAKKCSADLIVMATHGKTGIDAFFADSVAPRVASYAKRPVLLVPVAEA